MRDINKITFPVGMVLIIGPKIVDKFITPLSKGISIASAVIGLAIVIAGSIMADNAKKKQSK